MHVPSTTAIKALSTGPLLHPWAPCTGSPVAQTSGDGWGCRGVVPSKDCPSKVHLCFIMFDKHNPSMINEMRTRDD
jgi:hypothetical protein